MDWYPRNPQKFDGGTLGFSLAERGAYSGLTDYYYWSGEALPNDDEKLAALLRVSVEEWKAVAAKVRRKFRVKGKKLFHDVCERNLRAQQRFLAQSRINGKKGGRPKASNNPAGNQGVNPPLTPGVPNLNQGKERKGEERKEQEIKNPKSANGLNGHAHKNGNGVDLNLNPLRASRAFRNGEPSKADKHAMFEQKILRFVLTHYSQDAYAEMVALQLSDEPSDKRKRKDVFNAADADYQSRKTAGTLQPMD